MSAAVARPDTFRASGAADACPRPDCQHPDGDRDHDEHPDREKATLRRFLGAAVAGLDAGRGRLQVPDPHRGPPEGAISLRADEVHEVRRPVRVLDLLRGGERLAASHRRHRDFVWAGPDESSGLRVTLEATERGLLVQQHGHGARLSGMPDDDPRLPRRNGAQVIGERGELGVAVGVEVGDDRSVKARGHRHFLGQQRFVGRGRAGLPNLDHVVAGRDGERVGRSLRAERWEYQSSVEVDVRHQAAQSVDYTHETGGLFRLRLPRR